jgi:hypothetical protein
LLACIQSSFSSLSSFSPFWSFFFLLSPSPMTHAHIYVLNRNLREENTHVTEYDVESVWYAEKRGPVRWIGGRGGCRVLQGACCGGHCWTGKQEVNDKIKEDRRKERSCVCPKRKEACRRLFCVRLAVDGFFFDLLAFTNFIVFPSPSLLPLLFISHPRMHRAILPSPLPSLPPSLLPPFPTSSSLVV